MPPAVPTPTPHLLLVDEKLDQAQEALDGKASWLSFTGLTDKGVRVFASISRVPVQDLTDMETRRRLVERRRQEQRNITCR